MEKQLNQLLADLVVEYHKLQHFHWYVKGKDFFQVHAKLEEYYDSVRDDVDEVAEVILQINHEPLSTMKEFLATSHIQEPTSKFLTSSEIVAEVLKDFEHIYNEVRSLKPLADEGNHYLTTILLDSLIEKYAKNIWMLRQFSM